MSPCYVFDVVPCDMVPVVHIRLRRVDVNHVLGESNNYSRHLGTDITDCVPYLLHIMWHGANLHRSYIPS